MVGGVFPRYGTLRAGPSTFYPHKWDAKRQILKSVHESYHFPRDADLKYADDAPSTIFFLVNRRALEATITAKRQTAQENEPQSAFRLRSLSEVRLLLTFCSVHRFGDSRSRLDATSLPVNSLERSLKPEHPHRPLKANVRG